MEENVFENIAFQMVSNLSWPRCIKPASAGLVFGTRHELRQQMSEQLMFSGNQMALV